MRPSFREALSRPGILAFAHRGAGDVAPENTMAAFQGAVDMGFPVLETDIQASRDGTLYTFHDEDLQRLTGEPRSIGDLTDGEIAALRIKGKHQIPHLADVFEAFPDTLFNLDAKTDITAKPLAGLIKHMDRRDQVCIGSFSDRRINTVLRGLGSDTCHGLGLHKGAAFYLSARLHLALRFRAQCVQLPMQYHGINIVTPQSIAHAHRVGLKLHVWTVNDAKTMRHLIALGVDGIMTDNCALLKLELKNADLWR
ncbi:MAG: glycerophosphodiester phosphodiesterase [Alphaproteobacteria bacterium]|nr:glycerophosphodiester phosphodiesterase [Alphaproteobacteria bacterium]